MPYLTPDNAPVTLRGVTVYIPDDDEYIQFLMAALIELQQVENWEEYGSQGAADTAALWSKANDYTATTSIYPG